MTSRWRAGLTFNLLVVAVSFLSAISSARTVVNVNYIGAEKVGVDILRRGALLSPGTGFSVEMIKEEIARLDSIYFSYGYCGASIKVDTTSSDSGLNIAFVIDEGDEAHISSLSINGAEPGMEEVIQRLISMKKGDPFNPVSIQRHLTGVLDFLNDSGFPYAQVWLTGFSYDPVTNGVKLTISIVEGKKFVLKDVVFEGLTKTDSSFAMRLSRIKTGRLYREKDILMGVENIAHSDYFDSVGSFCLRQSSNGGVVVSIPVREKKHSNSFRGIVGFSRKTQGDYVLNGSVDLDLKNVAGTGRNAGFSWMNNGEKYSRVNFKYFEPFLLSLPVSAAVELGQVVEDTLFVRYKAGFTFKYPIGSKSSLVVGFIGDRNMPGIGELLKSTRQRYRIGFTFRGSGLVESISSSVDGVYRRSYYRGGRSITDYEAIYMFEGLFSMGTVASESLFFRLFTEGVVSSGEIPLAEKIPLGGAKTMRGYRENQFRGESIGFTNLEYRFGEGGGFFLFDDTGVVYNRSDGWRVHNGLGFGLRSKSPLGIVSLSFGVGDSISFEDTKIHIAMYQTF